MFIGLVETLSSIPYLREAKGQRVSEKSICKFCILDMKDPNNSLGSMLVIDSSNILHILFPETILFQWNHQTNLVLELVAVIIWHFCIVQSLFQ
jgi:hypothetical protein